jgi:methylmalonyl-CoA mutase cobalamin-binding subunit
VAARLVCVPAHDAADELAGQMFAQLAVRGGTATVLEYDLPRAEVLRRLAELGAEQVFISALEPFAFAQAREVCRDLRAHFPGLRIVVALWDLRAEAERFRRRLLAAGADEVVATLQEAVLAVRLSPTRTAEPADLARELKQALREDLPKAEALLGEAERLLPFEALAVEVLQPALEGLRDDGAAGRITDEQEKLAGDLLRDRLLALGGEPLAQGYRALAASASEEEEEIGLLILALLLRRAGWSVVHLGQRAPDESFDDVIAAVQPHAVLFSATLRANADRLLGLAEGLHRGHPDLLFVLDGPGFRPSAIARLDGAALRVGDDARDALAAIVRRMPPLPVPETVVEVEEVEEEAAEEREPSGLPPPSGLEAVRSAS